MCVASVLKGQQYSCLVLTGMDKDNSIHLLLQLMMKDIVFLGQTSVIASSFTVSNIATSCCVCNIVTMILM